MCPEGSQFCGHCGAALDTPDEFRRWLVAEVARLLAGKNCGRCGQATCAENAKAIVDGRSSYRSCVEADPATQARIRNLLERQAPPTLPWRSRLWQALTSVRLAVGVIVALLLLLAVGTLIPQNAQAFAYIQRYGLDGYRWIDRLQLDRLFRSWYFLALLVVLSINTICCTLKRSSVSARLLMRPMPTHTPEEISRLDYAVSLSQGPLAPAEALGRVATLLEQNHFHCAREGQGLKAHKNRFGRLGVDTLHISLVLILLGAAAGGMSHFEDFWIAHAGDVYNVPQKDFSVRVDKLWSQDYADSGRVKDWYTTLTVLEQDKAVLTRQIQVNQPLTYRGTNFYQASFGSDWQNKGTFSITVHTTDGAELGPYVLTSHGNVFLPENGLEISALTFMPDFAIDEQRRTYYNRSAQLNNPGLLVRVQKTDGSSYTTWAFTNSDMQQFYQTRLSAKTPYQVRMIGITAAQFTGLHVVSNPALPVIYAGFSLLGLGVFLNFYWAPRWVWVQLARGTVYVGATGRDGREFAAGFQQLVEALKVQLPAADSGVKTEQKELTYASG